MKTTYSCAVDGVKALLGKKLRKRDVAGVFIYGKLTDGDHAWEAAFLSAEDLRGLRDELDKIIERAEADKWERPGA